MMMQLGCAAALEGKDAAVEQLIGAEREQRGSHPTAWMLDMLNVRPLNSSVRFARQKEMKLEW